MNEHPYTNPSIEVCDEDEINLLELVRTVVRRKMLIIKICAAAIVLSVCYSLTLKNIYTATSSFYPPPRETAGSAFASLLAQSGAAQSALGGMSGSTDLYLAILKSRSVADAVVKRLDLQKTEKKELTLEAARKATVGAMKFTAGKDGIVTVAANNKDPKKAAILANTFVDEMVRRSVQLYVAKAGSERYFLEKRIEVVKAELKNAENALKDFQEKHKTIRIDAQASVAIEGIARIRAEIVSMEVQLATLRNSRTDESYDVKALQAAISRLKSQLGAQTGSGGADNIIPATGNVPEIAAEYTRKLRDVKIQEAIFEQLSRQFETAKVNEAKESSPVQIIDEAVPPLRKSKPRRSIIVILSTFSAFILSLGIIFIQEYLSNLSPEDAEIVRDIKQSLRLRKRDE